MSQNDSNSPDMGIKTGIVMTQDGISRPNKVGRAILLLYIALGISVLQIFIAMAKEFGQAMAPIVMLRPFATPAITLGLIYMIGQGKNWARIILLLLIILLDIAGLCVAVIGSIPIPPIQFFLYIAIVVIKVIAIVLLFHKSSSVWFRQMKTIK